ncbi:hypothetical protein BGZ97_011855, partial [Linnemannia gamsii]
MGFTDKDETEGVNNRGSHPQHYHHHHRVHGQDKCQSSGAYRDEVKQDKLDEEDEEDQEGDRHYVMAHLPYPPQKPLSKIGQQHPNRHHPIYHKQTPQQEVPESPPSLNSHGGSGGRGSAEEEDGEGEGSGGGGGREL